MAGIMNVVRDWFPDEKDNAFYLLVALILLCGLLTQWLFRKKLNLPPGPTGLPVVGYLPFLGKEPYKTLDRLKNKYGNIFRLRLGQENVVILADYTAVKDAFSNVATFNRPPGLFDALPEGFGFASKNGEEWSEQRRFVMKTMRDLGLGKSTWTSLIQEEVYDFLKDIEDKNGKPIDIHKYLSRSITNNICSLVFGKRYPPGPHLDSTNAAAEAVTRSFAQAGSWNYLPWFYYILAKLRIGNYNEIHNAMTAFNAFVRKEIEELRKFQNETQGSDFISQYLQTMLANRKTGNEMYFTESNMIGNAQVLFVGGSDTIRASLIWLSISMATYPDVQRKVFKELESSLEKEQIPFWEDRLKFPYTYAVILETQRWQTVVPLNTSRMVTANMKVCGYDIPKGSTIIANNWGLHNDSKYWKYPENFVPERFLLNDGKDVNLKSESYVPFSYGKRKCPGDNIAMMEIFLYFTSIVRRFEIRAPSGEKPKLEGILGILYQPVQQELCFIPRH